MTKIPRHVPVKPCKPEFPHPTCCLAKADYLYPRLPQEAKDNWKAAVKRKHISGYSLWMSECMHLFHRGLYAPDIPSISGGYSFAHVIPGDFNPAPPPELKPWDPVPDPPVPLPIPVPALAGCEWTPNFTPFDIPVRLWDCGAPPSYRLECFNGDYRLFQTERNPCIWEHEQYIKGIEADEWNFFIELHAQEYQIVFSVTGENIPYEKEISFEFTSGGLDAGYDAPKYRTMIYNGCKPEWYCPDWWEYIHPKADINKIYRWRGD